MSIARSRDPRAVRTREAFHRAFKELLKIKSYRKITVTDITEQAGFARHTFYNHYETKEDILNHLIDTVLDDFFSGLDKWSIFLSDHDEEIRMFTSFFQAWKDNPDVVEILSNIHFDVLLIERLKIYFTKFYYERVSKEMPSVDEELAKYVINFNAYTLLGILKPWFQDGMRHSPEVLAGFLIQLTGSSQRMQAVEKYQHVFRSGN